MLISVEFGLEWAMNFFSATGDGKGVHDGSSGDGSLQAQQVMLDEGEYPSNAYALFVAIRKRFGQPMPQANSSREDRAFTAKRHIFMIDELDLNHVQVNQSQREEILSDTDDF
jgi:hypothetical protein